MLHKNQGMLLYYIIKCNLSVTFRTLLCSVASTMPVYLRLQTSISYVKFFLQSSSTCTARWTASTGYKHRVLPLSRLPEVGQSEENKTFRKEIHIEPVSCKASQMESQNKKYRGGNKHNMSLFKLTDVCNWALCVILCDWSFHAQTSAEKRIWQV